MTGLKSNLQIVKLVGEGCFGKVFLGHDEVHGDVAVKVFDQKPDETDAEWQLRKSDLLHEGQSLKLASHQNVVGVYQLLEAESNDSVHLVMEYCSGGSLQSAYENGPITLQSVRKIATEVGFGLQALHARGMLHRDIKPSNLLKGSSGVLKLGDFGLVTDKLVLGYASQAGYVNHLAPEVWLGSGTTVRTDIWALGMTLYRLLHGQDWYKSLPSFPYEIIQNGNFRDSLKWLPHIPKAWRRLIRTMLSDDPYDRYQNVSIFHNALATLHVNPDWQCEVTPDEVSWVRQNKERRFYVKWIGYKSRSQHWKAWSEPLGKGIRRSLGGNEGTAKRELVVRELEKFFQKTY